MDTNYNIISDEFKRRFNREGLMVSAPGRVNLIGEHTDYNQGFVLPGAINRVINVCISENNTNKVRLYSINYKEYTEFELGSKIPTPLWVVYIYGVVYEINKKCNCVRGFDAVFGGDIPLGAGLSSSAALESAFAFGLNEIFNLGLTRLELAKIAQRAENIHVGVNCGIMDQFASLFGQNEMLLKLDCRSLEYEAIPFSFADHSLVLLDTRVKHSLAASEYNTRRIQCEEGVRTISAIYPEVKSLRDVEPAMLTEFKQKLSSVVYNRCEYVIEENIRLQNACSALASANITEVGINMYQSHEGLKGKYEVSCSELDFLVEIASGVSGVSGSRMMGGGFGGCTLSLVADFAIESLVEKASGAFKSKFGLEPLHYEVKIGNGVQIINNY